MAIHFGKFVHTQTGKYIMSILLGFGLASLFRTVCKGAGCLQFYAAPLDEIKDKIYKHDNKCYKYTTKSDHERFSKVLFDYFELVKKWNQNFSPRFSTSFQRVLTRSRTDWRIPVTSSASA